MPDINSRLASDEILIKDVDGSFKILKNGKIVSMEELKKGDFLVDDFSDKEARDIAIILKSKFGFSLDAEMADRFKNVILSYLKGVRDEMETNDVLVRPAGMGGVGIDRGTSKQMIDILRDKASIKQILSKEKEKKEVMEAIKKADLLEKEDAEEIEKYKKQIQTTPGPFAGKDHDIIVQRILERLSRSIGDERSAKIKSIVSSRVREVRNDMDTKTALGRPESEGGAGLNEEELKAAMEAIKEEMSRSKKFQEMKKEQVAMGVKKTREKEEEERKKGKEKEKEDRDRIFEKITGRKIDDFKDLKIKEERKRQVSVMKLQPPAEDMPEPKEEPGEPEKKSEPLFIGQKPVVSDSLARPRPKIEDVKYVPRVVGPLEELKEMTIEDFRNLGSPQQAVMKVEEKLKTLERQSFSKMIEGLKAWKKSEPYRSYLEIGQDSILNNKSSDEIIKEKQEAGKKILAPEEYRAVMLFNKKLKY